MNKNLLLSILVVSVLMVSVVSALTVTNPTVAPTNPTTEDTVTICADVDGEGFNIESVELSCSSNHPFLDEVMSDLGHPGEYCTEVWFSTWQDSEEVSCEITATDDDPAGPNIVTETVPEFTYDGENPVANAGEDDSVDEGVEIIFDGSDSEDSVTDSEDLIYYWDFGDESPVESEVGLMNPTHTYADNGEYEVTLIVEDEAGFVSDPDTMTVTVENVDPVANANGLYSGEEGSSVQLTGSATDVPADTLTYAWDLDDDGIYEVEGQNPIFDCVSEGTYDIALQVTDDDEGIGTDSTTVECNNAIPKIDELSVITPIDEEGITTLTASVSDTGDDTTLDYEIDWGDSSGNTFGSTSDGTISETHQYMDDDEYTVSLTVSDGEDETIGTASVTVNNLPPWNVNAGEDKNSAEGDTVQFSGNAEDVEADTLTYAWDFDDGETSDEQNPTHTYNDRGIYTVTLTVSDEDGGSSTDTMIVSVYNYQVELSEGWNLFSIPLVPEDTSIDEVLGEEVFSNADVIWAYVYDEEEGKNVWKYNVPIDGNWDSERTLNNIIPGYGYYIKMNEEVIVYNNGERMYGNSDNEDEWNVPKPPVVTLTPSWNLIGHYGMEKDIDKEDALDTLDSSYSTLLDKDGISISEMNPTEGYWLFITGTDNLDYAPSDAAYPSEV